MKKLILCICLVFIVASVSNAGRKGVYAIDTDGENANRVLISTLGYALNSEYGFAMNQDASLGDPTGIHDGTDSSYWTGSAINGTWDFSSTDQAYEGTKSVDGTNTVDGDIAQFANGVSDNNTAGIGEIGRASCRERV